MNVLFSVLLIYFYIGIIYLWLILFFPRLNIFFMLGILRKYKKVQYESEYFRDILTYSPSEIFYIYNKNFKNNIKGKLLKKCKFKKLFLINLLKMNLLGYINIDFKDKNNFKIIKKDYFILDEEYKFINEFIFNRITKNNEITLYEIYNYVDKNFEEEHFQKWDQFIEKKVVSRGFYDGNFANFYADELKKFYKISIPIAIIISLFAFIISINLGILLLIPLFLISGYYATKQIKIISDQAIYEYRKMVALKKFLKDFSIINERPHEYTKILDDYIVYANIFNIKKFDKLSLELLLTNRIVCIILFILILNLVPLIQVIGNFIIDNTNYGKYIILFFSFFILFKIKEFNN